jgi:hypothetical protein
MRSGLIVSQRFCVNFGKPGITGITAAHIVQGFAKLRKKKATNKPDRLKITKIPLLW